MTIENHIATGPFDGKITYTTTKDITSIIITGIPTEGGTTEKAIEITGTVNITTGTVKAGNCTKDTAQVEIGNAKAKITKDGKATLTIDIKIATAAKDAATLDALAHLATPLSPCKVEVSDNTITITIKYEDKTKKCIKTVITLDSAALKVLALKGGDLTAENITKITVTDNKGNKTTYKKDGADAQGTPSLTIKKGGDGDSATYNKVEAPAAPGNPTITIKKGGEIGEGTNAFTKQVGTGTQGTKNTIILNYTKGTSSGCITITDITDTP